VVKSVVVAFPTRRAEDGELWEPWVAEAALARHFGVSGRTVRRWREEGMPSHLIGGSRRYRISQAEAWHERRSA
jgi:phage terminase Nu1 subunit (DNA packaging protein)